MNVLDIINDIDVKALSRVEKKELLEQIRNEINSIDDSLVNLLDYRASKYEVLSTLKKHLGLDNYSPEREKEILERMKKSNTTNLQSGELMQIFERIIDISRAIQRRLRDKE